jgi:predicted DNA binding protein
MTTSPSSPDDGGVVEVEFAVTEPIYPFDSIAREEDCRIALKKILPRVGERQAEYFEVAGADPERVATLADENNEVVTDARPLPASGDRGLVELVVEDGCPARALAIRGALPTTVEGTPEGGTVVAEIMPEDDPGEIVDAVLDAHALELVAKRTRSDPSPLVDAESLGPAVLDELTDRQREVLTTAFDAGYYDRPRGKTGEEIATQLDISPTTFQEHVRAAERKLVGHLVEE